MCPICEGETLAQSDSPAAQRIKAYIQLRISQGATRSQIKKDLVDQWGTRSLAPAAPGLGPAGLGASDRRRPRRRSRDRPAGVALVPLARACSAVDADGPPARARGREHAARA